MKDIRSDPDEKQIFYVKYRMGKFSEKTEAWQKVRFRWRRMKSCEAVGLHQKQDQVTKEQLTTNMEDDGSNLGDVIHEEALKVNL